MLLLTPVSGVNNSLVNLFIRNSSGQHRGLGFLLKQFVPKTVDSAVYPCGEPTAVVPP